MSSSVKLGDDFVRVPRLEAAGANWVLYKDRMLWAADAKGIRGHLDGSTTEPVRPASTAAQATTAATQAGTGTAAATTQTTTTVAAPDPAQIKYEEDLVQWRKNEAIVKQLIAATISDSLFLKVRSKPTAHGIWEALANTFEKKSRMVSLDLRRRLQEERCGNKDDVRTHVTKLRTMYENLAAMGHPPSDDDFTAIILGSMPPSFDSYISSLFAASRLNAVTISPDDAMDALTDEYERRRASRPKGPDRKGNDADDVALAANDRTKSKDNVRCFKCKKLGHYKSECPSRRGSGGGKGGQGHGDSSKGKDNASAAKEKEKEKEERIEAWFVRALPATSTFHMSGQDSMNDDCISEYDSECDFEDGDSLPADAHTARNEPSSNFRIDAMLLDSGASRHMSPHRDRFTNYQPINPPRDIQAADNHSFQAIGKGDMLIMLPNGNKESKVLLRDVFHAPSMGMTLISVRRVAATGTALTFLHDTCTVTNPAGKVIAVVKVNNVLYEVPLTPMEAAAPAVEKVRVVTRQQLHRMMGHASYRAVEEIISKGMAEGVKLDPNSKPVACEICEKAKMTRKTISRTRVRPRATEIGEEVHVDTWGPSSVETLGKRRYNTMFTDDATRFSILWLQRTKDEAFESYKRTEAFYLTQKGARIKCLHSDRGGEFLSKEFTDHLQQQGTRRKLTTHDTPEYNGVAERLNRTTMEKVRAMIEDSKMPKFLWGEAVQHSVFLKNCTPTSALNGITPHEAFWGVKPNLANLHPWACKVYIHTPGGSKLSSRATVGHWMGFDSESDAHRVYWPEKRRVTVERNIKFAAPVESDDEIELSLEGEKKSVSTHPSKQDNSTLNPAPALPAPPARPSTPTAARPSTPAPSALAPIQPKSPARPAPPVVDRKPASASKPDFLGSDFEGSSEGRSKRVRKESSYVKQLRRGEGSATGRKGDPILPRGIQEGSTRGAYIEEIPEPVERAAVAFERAVVEEEDVAMAAVMAEAECLEPTYEEAKKRPDWPDWEVAIKAEIESLIRNETWEVVERPSNTNVVSCKWVLRVKKNSAGEIDKRKARLVARGYTQKYGLDYFDTYAPVAKLPSFRIILAIAGRNGWPVETFDFNSAYLNSKLDEEVYLEQPPGFEFRNRRKYVLRLKKALYGLKQGGRKWYETLCQALTDLSFKRSEADWGVFYKHEPPHITVLAMHVDDCMITGDHHPRILTYRDELNRRYKLTELGPISWLLGIKVSRDFENRTITLSQHAYIDTIITRFNFDDLKPVSTPMNPNVTLSKSQCPESVTDIARMRRVPYREAVGALMYAAMGTRPDIAFAVSTLAQYSHNPGWAHWEAVKHIFRYLLGTKNLSLEYGGERKGLEGFVDADGASQEHRHAITGYVYLIDGGAVSWASKKQELVTLSTAEAEYVAATHAAKEGIWLRRLIGEVFRPLTDPTTLYNDNQSAIALTKDGSYHARTKHIDVRYHFIRYVIEAGSIRLLYCPTNDMTADILTKALPSLKVKHFASALGLAMV